MKRIAIIGAGAAGLTAGIFAAGKNTEVTIYERTNIAGKKILVSGGTRCNVLPVSMTLEDYFTDSSPNIMKNIFKTWTLDNCKEWFEKEVGLKLAKETDSNKWFPKSNSAMEVRDKLLDLAYEKGVRLKFDAPIKKIAFRNEAWQLLVDENESFTADIVIVATGGYSIPKMGTDGMGHNFLKKIGHSVNDTYPALTPLKGEHPGKDLIAGISLNVELNVQSKNSKKQKAKRTGFLFTHRGFSGPSILDISHHAVKAMEAKTTPPDLLVNWNGFSLEEWSDLLAPQKGTISAKLKSHLPERLVEALLRESGITHNSLSELKKEERKKLLNLLTSYKLSLSGHEGYQKAEVTGGGIPLEEINASTMESKLCKNLFLCGEIVDVFGRIGGFNFYWAWLSGRLAGLSANKSAVE